MSKKLCQASQENLYIYQSNESTHQEKTELVRHGLKSKNSFCSEKLFFSKVSWSFKQFMIVDGSNQCFWREFVIAKTVTVCNLFDQCNSTSIAVYKDQASNSLFRDLLFICFRTFSLCTKMC